MEQSLNEIDWDTKVRLTCPRCGLVSVTPQAVLDGHVARVTHVECPKDGEMLASVQRNPGHGDGTGGHP